MVLRSFVSNPTRNVWRHKGSCFHSQALFVRPTRSGLCQAYFSSFPPKLFVRLFIILVQRGMNT